MRLINSSAEDCSRPARQSDRPDLSVLAPELDRQLDSDRARTSSSSPREASRTPSRSSGQGGGGHVLTFDDITDQLLDQRRAAWSDVARRIATDQEPFDPDPACRGAPPRRYGSEIISDARRSSA